MLYSTILVSSPKVAAPKSLESGLRPCSQLSAAQPKCFRPLLAQREKPHRESDFLHLASLSARAGSPGIALPGCPAAPPSIIWLCCAARLVVLISLSGCG